MNPLNRFEVRGLSARFHLPLRVMWRTYGEYYRDCDSLLWGHRAAAATLGCKPRHRGPSPKPRQRGVPLNVETTVNHCCHLVPRVKHLAAVDTWFLRRYESRRDTRRNNGKEPRRENSSEIILRAKPRELLLFERFSFPPTQPY